MSSTIGMPLCYFVLLCAYSARCTFESYISLLDETDGDSDTDLQYAIDASLHDDRYACLTI